MHASVFTRFDSWRKIALWIADHFLSVSTGLLSLFEWLSQTDELGKVNFLRSSGESLALRCAGSHFFLLLWALNLYNAAFPNQWAEVLAMQLKVGC